MAPSSRATEAGGGQAGRGATGKAVGRRAGRVRAIVALGVIAVSAYLTVTTPVRLGIDLRGGTQIVLETRDSPTAKADAAATDRTLEVLRRRVDALGVAEPNLARSGDNRIIVELPGLQDARQAADVLGRTAQLTFHPVLGVAGAAAPTPRPENGARSPAEQVLADASGERLRLGPAALSGGEVASAEAATDPQAGPGWFVALDLRGAGEEAWARLTGEAACAAPGDPARRVAIVLDGKIVSSPQVDPSVACRTGILGGSTQITGGFGHEEARELATLITGGALPVPVETVEQRTVGPSLGAEAIAASMWAAIIGTALTCAFIVTVYRLFGALAALALACYGLVAYAAMLAIGATLTLPGLAGFVLAIGMAVDANVLVFERTREEYAARRGRDAGDTSSRPSDGPRGEQGSPPSAGRGSKGSGSLRAALAAGFRNAFSAIADSNVTTLLAAGLLFFLASGSVRGFGVTLSIGVLASMFSALVITRVLAEYAVARRSVRARPWLTGVASAGRVRERLAARNPNLMRHPRRWLAGSAAALVLATSGVAVRGLDFGVEFTGGRLIEYSTAASVDPDRARSALAEAGFPRAVVQASGDGDLTVRTDRLTEAQEARIAAAIGELGGAPETVRDELIGPSLGDELRRAALVALGVALAAQMAYLAVRFRWTFGAAAVTAMAHDVLILIGVFAWLGKPIDGVFLAALLTVIGYSVNDSVVVFDRIRELRTADRKAVFARVANSAILQTLPRTINTGMGAVFILAALALLGGDSLTDFALALLIGIVVGTYSSMFTAAPLAIELESRTGPAAAGDRGRTRR
ncbi:protein translocase subunit SecD [Sphaerisporangium perillae]|uniref:protein translocase subunit SecD n=1 Tax=Sphaerisporangium perillae TaxID=2935860 RepID=UPI00200BF23F|nr:protein translocase subunit SecD [Sphaerisporangium perillae]